MAEKAKTHSERAHALCSASGAERWMNCPGSVALQEGMPVIPSSVYAEEGTRAHELAERFLAPIAFHYNARKELPSWSSLGVMDFTLEGQFPEEMIDHCRQYAELIYENLDHYKPKKVCIEERVDFDVELGMFGTADCFFAFEHQGKKVLSVWDLKYGKGHVVEATSPQLLYYACAVQKKYKKIQFDDFWLNIYQPRADHEEGQHRVAIFQRKDIEKWTSKFFLGANEALYQLKQFKKTGDKKALLLNAGAHCKFCSAKTMCDAYNKRLHEIAGMDFADDPDLLVPAVVEQRHDLISGFDPERAARLLSISKEVETWFENLRNVAQSYIIAGGTIPGWKIVRGRSARKWKSNQEEVAKKLQELGVDDPFTHKLKGIGEIERALREAGIKGKKSQAAAIADLTFKPPGSLSLAPEDDERPAVTGASLAAIDFASAEEVKGGSEEQN